MHSTLRAPELSATSSTVSDCTMSVPTGPTRRRASSHCLFENRPHGPALISTQRPRLANQHAVPDIAAVLFVMCLELLATAEVLLVLGMLHQALDQHHNRLVHLVADDHQIGRASCR